MKAPSPPVRRFAAVVALIAWSALLLQLVLSLRLATANGRGVGWGVVVYFGYFTILTNILVALALSAPLVAPGSPLGRFFARPGVITAVAASIALVGATYFLILQHTWEPEGLALVADVALHYVVPALFLLYWWLAVPKHGLRWANVARWALYPLGYLAYALVRGEVVGVYPYPFVDVGALGYGRVLVNALGVAVAFAGVALLLVAVGRLQKEPAAPPVGGG